MNAKRWTEAEMRLRMVKEDLRMLEVREERMEKERRELLLRLIVLRDMLRNGS